MQALSCRTTKSGCHRLWMFIATVAPRCSEACRHEQPPLRRPDKPCEGLPGLLVLFMPRQGWSRIVCKGDHPAGSSALTFWPVHFQIHPTAGFAPAFAREEGGPGRSPFSPLLGKAAIPFEPASLMTVLLCFIFLSPLDLRVWLRREHGVSARFRSASPGHRILGENSSWLRS